MLYKYEEGYIFFFRLAEKGQFFLVIYKSLSTSMQTLLDLLIGKPSLMWKLDIMGALCIQGK